MTKTSDPRPTTHDRVSSTAVLLEAKDLTKSYRQGQKPVEVLKGVSLSVKAGEMAVVVGPSGAGKSTLLSILGGLDAPTSGEVLFDGRNLHALPEKELAEIRNKAFGFVFQFYHLVPELTAEENVALPAWISEGKTGSSQTRKQAQELLKAVGLADRLTHRPSELSGGEQQRVAIARALINTPRLVFCDEPTGNLDSATGAEVLNILVRLHRESGTAFVIVTHEGSVTKVAGRVLSLNDGKLTG